MQTQRSNRSRRLSSWQRIPSARRHFYVYSLLLLGAIVGNNVKNVIAGPIENDSPVASDAARMEGMKQSVKELYRN